MVLKKDEDVEPDIIITDIKIGDHVRISKDKKLFEKGYTNNQAKEIFIVEKIIYQDPILFIIKDLNNETL